MKQIIAVALVILSILLSGSVIMVKAEDRQAEETNIKRVIEASIGWALTKDFNLLYSSLAHDSSFFIYHPDNASTIVGFDAFKKYAETLFRGDQFKATRFEVKNLRINTSTSGEVAWYSCLLDDFGEWNGVPGGWENCRWTGVLEKRAGKWVIVQMHFSFATDQKSSEGTAPPAESKE